MPGLDELKSSDSMKLKILLGIFTVFFIVLMFPKGESIESDVPVGSIWIHDDLIASFSFPVFKDPDVYKKEMKEAAKSVLPVFVRENNINVMLNDSLKVYNLFLLNSLEKCLLSGTFSNPTFLSDTSFNELLNLKKHENSTGKKNRLNLNEFFLIAQKTIDNSYQSGILSIRSDNRIIDSIAVRTGTVDKIETVAHFLPIDQVKKNINEIIHKKFFPRDYESALVEYSDHFILPNLIYSPNLTEEEIHQDQANVSKYTGIINENERIIGKQGVLREYDVRGVTTGRDSLGESTVRVEICGQIYSGIGNSPDVLEASARAYLNAFNRYFANINNNGN